MSFIVAIDGPAGAEKGITSKVAKKVDCYSWILEPHIDV